jgi:hypothetical protein
MSVAQADLSPGACRRPRAATVLVTQQRSVTPLMSKHVQTRHLKQSLHVAIVDAPMYLMDRLPYILFLQRLKVLSDSSILPFGDLA